MSTKSSRIPRTQGTSAGTSTLSITAELESALERAGLGPVAGVDEAGRGACAGPIAIAACILPNHPVPELAALDDSKKLTPAKRAVLEGAIRRHAVAYSVVLISAADIDTFGVTAANGGGMRRAIAALPVRPGFVLSDAFRVEGLTQPLLPVIGGDGSCRCIAAASILAKQARDRVMEAIGSIYPEYNFDRHKGYGTKAHMDAVRQHGGCKQHRYSYANIKQNTGLRQG